MLNSHAIPALFLDVESTTVAERMRNRKAKGAHMRHVRAEKAALTHRMIQVRYFKKPLQTNNVFAVKSTKLRGGVPRLSM
jgi:hypothetical protein